MSNKQIVQLDEKLEHEERQSDSSGRKQRHALLLPPPSEPMAVARKFADDRCLYDAIRTLRYWRSGWWRWNTAHWIELDDRTVRSVLYRYTEHAVYLTGDNKI